ncbi:MULTISPECIES: hypothetical protein [Latilactobacillus]|uniref:Uncharacterized protein n=2 Tax=Latilactobacillus TaxID=2767885 RepID=A0ABN6GL98_LATCU|nr:MULTISPECIES: hypothetical protein [Latilactobacillus]ASN13614.1 hypothetical protein B4V05_10305 [Latilactobacillus sakei]MCW8780317.1 hypothetical protein [Latilactobacillus curvatus]UTB73265.1 hypothetical protein A4W72_10930 [Latilactobacillus curvatus]BCX31556.1 hypothetical protein LTWDN19_21230 [Latilactobacillus curvatus]
MRKNFLKTVFGFIFFAFLCIAIPKVFTNKTSQYKTTSNLTLGSVMTVKQIDREYNPKNGDMKLIYAIHDIGNTDDAKKADTVDTLSQLGTSNTLALLTQSNFKVTIKSIAGYKYKTEITKYGDDLVIVKAKKVATNFKIAKVSISVNQDGDSDETQEASHYVLQNDFKQHTIDFSNQQNKQVYLKNEIENINTYIKRSKVVENNLNKEKRSNLSMIKKIKAQRQYDTEDERQDHMKNIDSYKQKVFDLNGDIKTVQQKRKDWKDKIIDLTDDLPQK